VGISPLRLYRETTLYGEDLSHFPTGGHLTTPAIQGNHTQDYMVNHSGYTGKPRTRLFGDDLSHFSTVYRETAHNMSCGKHRLLLKVPIILGPE
jgi:hypothetical protein